LWRRTSKIAKGLKKRRTKLTARMFIKRTMMRAATERKIPNNMPRTMTLVPMDLAEAIEVVE
jgi:hypothetical protein